MQLAILCSLDSFLAAMGMGLTGCPNRYRVRLAFSFMGWDMLAAIAGALLHTEMAATAALVLAILAGLTVVLSARKMPVSYLLMPALLCLDNFVCGARREPRVLELLALMSGLCSGMAAWAGFCLAHRVKRSLSPSAVWLGGMVIVSVLLMV